MAHRSAARMCVLAGLFGYACVTAAQSADDPQIIFQKAMAATERGDDAVALDKYRELLRMHPEAVAARVNLGATLSHMKRFDDAVEQERIVLAADPGNELAQMDLAAAYQGKGDFEAAIRTLEALHAEDANANEPLALLAECYVQDGQMHFALGQYDIARRDVDAARRWNPEAEGLHTLDGMILEQMADYDKAAQALQQSLAADANDFQAHLYLGAIFYFKREMTKAREELTQALALKPDSAQARYELALVERADGHLREAAKELETVVEQMPDWLQPHVELSAVYYRLQRLEDGARERALVDRMMSVQQKNQAQSAMPR